MGSLVLPSSLVGMGTHVKVGIFGYTNLRTMSTDKWATSKSTQLSTKFVSNCSFCLKMP